MFVRHHSVIEIPFYEARRRYAELVAEQAGGSSSSEDPGGRLDSIGFELPPVQVRKRVELTLGEPRDLSPQVLVADVSWRASGPEALFPVWEGKLEVAGHGARRTRLSLSGNYVPPLGGPGHAMDRMLMNRVAKASVADFLDRLGQNLVGRAASQAGPG